jgi:hypothetical protein
MVIIFFGMTITFYLIAGYIPFFSGLNRFMVMGFAILFAGISLSTSPSTAIGIITELQSQGKVTNIVLIITVLKAILLILFFPIIITLSKQFYLESISFNLSLLADISLQLLASILTGIVMGGVIIWYLKKVKVEMSLFLLGITLAITEVSSLDSRLYQESKYFLYPSTLYFSASQVPGFMLKFLAKHCLSLLFWSLPDFY